MTTGQPLTPGGGLGQRTIVGALDTPGANAGLIWARYLPLWSGNDRAPDRTLTTGDRTGRATGTVLLNFVCRYKESGKSAASWLEAWEAQRRAALEHLARRSGRVLRIVSAKTVSRLASGLGGDHPTENGFSFDPSSGLPVLSGSAVKGLCRRAAWLDGRDEDTITRWFGPSRITAQTTDGQGTVTFFDALPQGWPRLVVDIITCHHPAYYGALGTPGGQAQPTETESPVPVFFLAVDKGVKFSFPFLAPSDAEARAIAQVLETGLGWLGLGAKTAVGYGLMEVVP